MNAHCDDINSVCFVNNCNSNIFYTGSDDCTIKVWDRRILANKKSVIGSFVGHTEGITSVTSKDDSLYLASNSKDQFLKVWDIRKLTSRENFN